jgi:hypothetical protein
MDNYYLLFAIYDVIFLISINCFFDKIGYLKGETINNIWFFEV